MTLLRELARRIRHLLGLEGAEVLLRVARPDLLLSVYPRQLKDYGDTRLDYEVRCLSVDHEEHWWCGARTPAGSAA